MGRHLRKLKYRLGKLPDNLRSETQLSKCTLESAQCETCPGRSDCVPVIEDEELPPEDVPTLGLTLENIVSGAKRVLGPHGWNQMTASLGPRYGGQRSTLSGLTLGLRTDASDQAKFIPFEQLSSGEKYSLSFALAKAQVPGDRPPLILMEEPETTLYPSAVAMLLGDLQAIPTGDAPQIIISSHSESVLRCFSPEHVFIMGGDHQPSKLDATIKDTKPVEEPSLSVEYLIMPGGPSALFADKVLLVEGAQEAVTSGHLGRLATKIAATRKESSYHSFSSQGWCIFETASADRALGFVRVFLGLGKKVATLFDADEKGKDAATKTKDLCPTFIYESDIKKHPTLEDALLVGLPKEEKDKVLADFFSHNQCSKCDKRERDCWKEKGEDCYLGGRDKRKSHLQNLCMERFRTNLLFPQAFKTLLIHIDSAKEGTIHKLHLNSSAGKSEN